MASLDACTLLQSEPVACTCYRYCALNTHYAVIDASDYALLTILKKWLEDTVFLPRPNM